MSLEAGARKGHLTVIIKIDAEKTFSTTLTSQGRV
jgi:hypothetical protein